MQSVPRKKSVNPFLWIVLGFGILASTTVCLIMSTFWIVKPVLFSPASETAAPAYVIQTTRTILPSVTTTSTITPSPTASLTATSTLTQAPFLTPTPPATMTPATAEKKNEYMIPHVWTRDTLPYILSILESLPGSLPVAQSGELSDYYEAFYPAALAYGEAVQITGGSITTTSELGLAITLARVGNPQAAQAYALAASSALNKGLTDLPSLCDWLRIRQSELTFRCHAISANNFAYARTLMEITGAGSALILIEQMPGGYSGIALASLFDFTHPQESRLLLGDLTGDSVDEVIFWQKPLPGVSPFIFPLVFDISQPLPNHLPFPPDETLDINLEYVEEWSLVSQADGAELLDLKVSAFPACPFNIHRRYRWDGVWLSHIVDEIHIDAAKEMLGYCTLLVDHALHVWEPSAAAQVIEQVLPSWPPAAVGDDLPVMSKQELLTHLGIVYALQGDYPKANELLEQASMRQTPNDDFWSGEAIKFLNNYQKKEDIYRACVAVKACEPRLALVTFSPMFLSYEGDYPTALTRLSPLGVVIRASGLFDFDGDKIPEAWFTLAPRPGAYLEFWILSRKEQGLQFLFVETLNTNLPKPTIIDKTVTPQAVQVDEQMVIRFFPAQGGASAYVETYHGDYFWDTYTPHILQTNAEKLIFDASPQDVLVDLLALQSHPHFSCLIEHPSCPMFYTLLGLACQRSHDTKCAVANYLTVWRKYPASPYTAYARLKLTRDPMAPTLTFTPTQTFTPYGGKSLTPRPILPQPTRTFTPTPRKSQFPVQSN